MNKLKNPFTLYGYAGAEYFCDREEETAHLISSLRNGRNVTLMSPRRMGKTGLILHAFEQLAHSDKDCVCIYVDIFPTKSLTDFVMAFGKSVLGQSQRLYGIAEKISSLFRSANLIFSADPLTGSPQMSLDFHPNNSLTTLQDIFNSLKHSGKECFVAIDEFQQVTEYPEEGVEAILRQHVQFAPNVHFVFSGSKQHLMTDIFISPSRPFYRSTEKFGIGPIKEESYYQFSAKWFSKICVSFDREAFHRLYDKLEGHTWYLQYVLNRLYQSANTSGDVIVKCISEIIESETDNYQKLYDSLTQNQANLLRAIACEKYVPSPQSGNFLKKYNLKAASSVNRALQYLLDKEFVFRTPQGWEVYDRFMAIWLRRL